MTPEEYMTFVEGINTFADAITTARTALVERGWTAHGAEQAAVLLMSSTVHA
jgi:hypothetical protein